MKVFRTHNNLGIIGNITILINHSTHSKIIVVKFPKFGVKFGVHQIWCDKTQTEHEQRIIHVIYTCPCNGHPQTVKFNMLYFAE